MGAAHPTPTPRPGWSFLRVPKFAALTPARPLRTILPQSSVDESVSPRGQTTVKVVPSEAEEVT